MSKVKQASPPGLAARLSITKPKRTANPYEVCLAVTPKGVVKMVSRNVIIEHWQKRYWQWCPISALHTQPYNQ